MRKIRIIYFSYLLVLTVSGFVMHCYYKAEPKSIKIYYADRQMMRLVPVSYDIERSNPGKLCDRIIEELTYDRGYNSNIRQLIPDKAVSVKIKNEVAIVNIKTEFFEEAEQNRNYETLIVYQLVNSLSSIEGVARVEFLIDGKQKKDFMGFIDMRDVFVPDYYV